MPGAFGHLIGAWIVGKALTKFGVKIGRFSWAALLLGALAPDTDLLLDWTVDYLYIHRTFTHSFAGVFFAGLIALFVLGSVRKFMHLRHVELASALFSLGILTHILLDLNVGSSGLQVFWPNNEWITLNEPLNHIDGVPTYEELKYWVKMMVTDAALGVTWLAYLFWTKRLRFEDGQ